MELKLDIISGFHEDFYGREFSLRNFKIVENYASNNDMPKLRLKHTESIGYRGKLIRKINNIVSFNSKYEIRENNLKFNPEILNVNRSCYLIGFWQSEEYFKPIKEIINEEFEVKSPLEGKNLETAKKIGNSNSVGIHLRRTHGISGKGKHQKAVKRHGSVTLDYYNRSIAFLKSRFNDLELFIFSDDAEWAMTNFKSDFQTNFIIHNSDDKNYEDLRLLSLCKHQIIANSTFSWWAAWLNKNEKKIIIAPHKWYQDTSMDTSSLIPQSWIKL